MSTGFPNLIKKFLVSKNILDRIELSRQIFEILAAIGDFGKIELTLREHFIMRIKVFAINTFSNLRSSIVEIANFYAKNYLQSEPELCLSN